MAGMAKMWAQRLDHFARLVWRLLQIGVEGEGNKPPRMVVEGSVVAALMEFVQPQSETEPKNLSFQIGLAAVIDQVMGPAKRQGANGKRTLRIDRGSIVRVGEIIVQKRSALGLSCKEILRRIFLDLITQSPALDNALINPSNWADERWVHEQFAPA